MWVVVWQKKKKKNFYKSKESHKIMKFEAVTMDMVLQQFCFLFFFDSIALPANVNTSGEVL